MSLKIFTLNIEGDKHLKNIVSFLLSQNFDVVCLQEVFEKDLEEFKVIPNIHILYSAQRNRKSIIKDIYYNEGCVMITKLSIEDSGEFYYHGSSDIPSNFISGSAEHIRRTESRSLQWIKVKDNERKTFTIMNTHFTWTDDGLINDFQKNDYQILHKKMSEFDDVIICGDFNMPRDRNELYKMFLEDGYVDHIPQNIITSIDVNIHERGQHLIIGKILQHTMVDYVFSTSNFTAKNFKHHHGLSDHFGIEIEIKK